MTRTRFIELLNEKRQALITQAVTKGIDPNVKMRDSGVEWIGEVPEHWEVKTVRHACQIETQCHMRAQGESGLQPPAIKC